MRLLYRSSSPPPSSPSVNLIYLSHITFFISSFSPHIFRGKSITLDIEKGFASRNNFGQPCIAKLTTNDTLKIHQSFHPYWNGTVCEVSFRCFVYWWWHGLFYVNQSVFSERILLVSEGATVHNMYNRLGKYKFRYLLDQYNDRKQSILKSTKQFYNFFLS